MEQDAKMHIFIPILTFLACASIIFSLIIPIMFWIAPPTRKHPAPILLGISIMEIICSYHLLIWCIGIQGTADFLEKLSIFHKQGFASPSKPSVIKNICLANQSLYLSAFFIQFALYYILSLDLTQTLLSPLLSLKKKLLSYLGIFMMLVFTYLFQIYNAVQLFCSGNDLNINISIVMQAFFQDFSPLFSMLVIINSYNMLILKCCLFSLTIFTFIYSEWNLYVTRKQFDSHLYKLKKEYVRNQLFYLRIYSFIWLVPFINFFLQDNQTLGLITFIIIIGQGIISGLLRFRETYFRFKVKFMFKQILRRVKQEDFQHKALIEMEEEAEQNPCVFSLQKLMNNNQIEKIIICILISISRAIKESEQSFIGSNLDIKKCCSEEKKHKFQLDDFEQNEGNIQEPLLSKDLIVNIELTELAPKIFKILREKDGWNNKKLFETFKISNNLKSVKQTSESLGKSGAFFFFSQDNMLIMKTMEILEYKTLKEKVLFPYVNYIMKNEASLIARIYGVYKIIVKGFAPIILILMENTFQKMNQIGGCDRVYDLKGSLHKRKVNEVKKKGQVQKDLNFLESRDLFINMKKNSLNELLNQLKKDSDFLVDCKLMDYSMLIGIKDEVAIENINSNSWRCFQGADKVLSISIIDFLQEFNFRKKLEFFFKSKMTDGMMISSIEPNKYKERFDNFINQIFTRVYTHD